MNALLRKLFRRPAAPVPKTAQQLADDTVTAAHDGLGDLFRELGPPDVEPADVDDAMRKAYRDLTSEVYRFIDEDPDGIDDLFARLGQPDEVADDGCWYCRPGEARLSRRLCRACEARRDLPIPQHETDPGGPR